MCFTPISYAISIHETAKIAPMNIPAPRFSSPLPLRDGVKPSYLCLPHDARYIGQPLLSFLCERFPFVDEAGWRARLNSGFVVAADGAVLSETTPYRAGETIYYYREISREDEPRIPFDEVILHVDEHLIVVDKPHFLPVIPSGRFLRETLLTRLRLRPELQHLNVADITPIHRLDKDTTGLILHRPEEDSTQRRLEIELRNGLQAAERNTQAHRRHQCATLDLFEPVAEGLFQTFLAARVGDAENDRDHHVQ